MLPHRLPLCRQPPFQGSEQAMPSSWGPLALATIRTHCQQHYQQKVQVSYHRLPHGVIRTSSLHKDAGGTLVCL